MVGCVCCTYPNEPSGIVTLIIVFISVLFTLDAISGRGLPPSLVMLFRISRFYIHFELIVGNICRFYVRETLWNLCRSYVPTSNSWLPWCLERSYHKPRTMPRCGIVLLCCSHVSCDSLRFVPPLLSWWMQGRSVLIRLSFCCTVVWWLKKRTCVPFWCSYLLNLKM